MNLHDLIINQFFRVFSLGITAFVIFAVFSIYTGALGVAFIMPTILMLSAAVAFRYTVLYHQFTRIKYRYVFGVITGFVALMVTVTTVYFGSENIVLHEIQAAVDDNMVSTQNNSFLPEWWYGVVLLFGSFLILLGGVQPTEKRPYPRPTELGSVAKSPVYYGFVSAFFGVWAVGFVGFSIQRIIVIAPIFEELLKFGIALFVSSVLFGRSMTARVGVALIVGSLFGVIEHATSYPGESDVIYLYRTLFHAVTPAVSVAVYTMFAESGTDRLLWVAPVFSMIFHFFYNTFVVLSGVIMLLVFEVQIPLVSIVYGAATVLVSASLLLMAVIRHRIIYMIYEPVYEVLSELV